MSTEAMSANQGASAPKDSAINDDSIGGTAPSPDKPSPPAKRDPKSNLRPWKPGQSGNPAGRPKVEPKVRKLARTYDKRMVAVLASIAEDKDVPPSERRKCASELIAIGSGRPELVQSVAGKDGPLLGVTFNNLMGAAPAGLDAASAYRLMVNGTLDPSPDHPAFADRRPIETIPALPPAADSPTPAINLEENT